MEDIAPPLSLVVNVRTEMQNGRSFRESLRSVLESGGDNDFLIVLKEWLVLKTHDQPTARLAKGVRSPHRRALLDLFDRAWIGEPILEALGELEQEIRQAADHELEQFIATLPFRAMLPLLLLQFPAYLLLLIGPILADIAHASPAADVYMAKLRSAQSPTEISLLQNRFHALSLQKRVCDTQLKDSLIPWACYQWAQGQKEWQVLSAEETLLFQKQLDRKCELAARANLRSAPDLLAVPQNSLSAECLRVVSKALEIDRYRSEEISTSLGSGFEK